MGTRGSQLWTHIRMLWKHRQLQQKPNRAVETTGVSFACRRALQKAMGEIRHISHQRTRGCRDAAPQWSKVVREGCCKRIISRKWLQHPGSPIKHRSQ
jgi:hypothetical protein